MQASTQLGAGRALPSSNATAFAGRLPQSAPFTSFAAAAATCPTASGPASGPAVLHGQTWQQLLGPSMPILDTPAHALLFPSNESEEDLLWRIGCGGRIIASLDTASIAPPAAPNCVPSSQPSNQPSSQPETAAAVDPAGASSGAAGGMVGVKLEARRRQWAVEEAGEAAVKCEVEMEEEAMEAAVPTSPTACTPVAPEAAAVAAAAAAAAVAAPRRQRRNPAAAAARCSPAPKRAVESGSGGRKRAPARRTQPGPPGTSKTGGSGGKKITKAGGSGKGPKAASPVKLCVCGQPLYTGERKPGRTPKDDDARLLPEHKLDLAFLQLHFVDNRMTYRDAYRHHAHSYATYSRHMREEGLVHL